MNKYGEIIVVEDDIDDQLILEQIFRELEIKNTITFLADGQQAYNYFNHTDKDLFLIISDINMPRMNGIELRDKMQQYGEVKLRTIPFLFLTTGTANENVVYAYCKSVQGFFTKPSKYEEMKTMIKAIIDYWSTCREPQYHGQ